MPEITIKYNNPKTLQALRDFAKYFDFIISTHTNRSKKEIEINGVSIIPPQKRSKPSSSGTIFLNRKIDAKSLRSELWNRKK